MVFAAQGCSAPLVASRSDSVRSHGPNRSCNPSESIASIRMMRDVIISPLPRPVRTLAAHPWSRQACAAGGACTLVGMLTGHGATTILLSTLIVTLINMFAYETAAQLQRAVWNARRPRRPAGRRSVRRYRRLADRLHGYGIPVDRARHMLETIDPAARDALVIVIPDTAACPPILLGRPLRIRRLTGELYMVCLSHETSQAGRVLVGYGTLPHAWQLSPGQLPSITSPSPSVSTGT